MTILEFTTQPEVKQRVEYIFQAFRDAFPKIRYDERGAIIGIGEQGKRLLCYFIEAERGKLVKFKTAAFGIPVLSAQEEIDAYIQETIRFFQDNAQDTQTSTAVRRGRSETYELGWEEENKVFTALMESVSPSCNDVRLETILPYKMTPLLEAAGVYTVGDLRKHTYGTLRRIHGIGKKRCMRLLTALQPLRMQAVPQSLQENGMDALTLRATEKLFVKMRQDSSVAAYLRSIDYDQTQFKDGTIGKTLCLWYKKQMFAPIVIPHQTLGEMVAQYTAGAVNFQKFAENVHTFLAETLTHCAYKEQELVAVSTYYGFGQEPRTLREIAIILDVSHERVRQIINKVNQRAVLTLQADTEFGIGQYIRRTEILQQFQPRELSGLFIYLLEKKGNTYTKMAERLLLCGVGTPDSFGDKVQMSLQEYKREQNERKASKPQATLPFKNFKLITDENGEVLTDVDLLLKLKSKRWGIAVKMAIPPYIVYTNAQLVLLATYCPKTKTEYVACGLRESTWDTFGYIMAEIIKEHNEE